MGDKIFDVLKSNLQGIADFVKSLQEIYKDLVNLLEKFSQILSKLKSLFKYLNRFLNS